MAATKRIWQEPAALPTPIPIATHIPLPISTFTFTFTSTSTCEDVLSKSEMATIYVRMRIRMLPASQSTMQPAQLLRSPVCGCGRSTLRLRDVRRCDAMRCRPYDSDNDNDNTTTKTRTTNGGNGARQLHKSTTFSVLKRLAIHSWLWPLLPSPSTIRILRLSLGSRIFDFAEQSNPLGFPAKKWHRYNLTYTTIKITHHTAYKKNSTTMGCKHKPNGLGWNVAPIKLTNGYSKDCFVLWQAKKLSVNYSSDTHASPRRSKLTWPSDTPRRTRYRCFSTASTWLAKKLANRMAELNGHFRPPTPSPFHRGDRISKRTKPEVGCLWEIEKSGSPDTNANPNSNPKPDPRSARPYNRLNAGKLIAAFV
uniref:HDC12949 n=1 Tax=Drosophila melanogaster TaxID=7227 RepID=Q6IKB8_DROME|nr:TPA_inf: HDC12949 [Drosophila melanogaster]